VRLGCGHLADPGRHDLEVVDAIAGDLAVGRTQELGDLVHSASGVWTCPRGSGV
jgi:hypothetical protein